MVDIAKRSVVELRLVRSKRSLVVPAETASKWREVSPAIQCRLESFLSGTTVASTGITTDRQGVPDMFSDDLCSGGPTLRSAFPELERRLVEVQATDSSWTITVESEGAHTNVFYGMMNARGLHVRFVETHVIEGRDNDVERHHVTVDLASIVRQLIPEPRSRGASFTADSSTSSSTFGASQHRGASARR